MTSQRILRIFSGIISITAIVVIPGIILNYHDFGKPYSGFFPIIFVNKPIAIFLNSGFNMVTETGACGPIEYCSVTFTGWMLLVLFWLLLAWVFAWLISALLGRYSRIESSNKRNDNKA